MKTTLQLFAGPIVIQRVDIATGQENVGMLGIEVLLATYLL